MNNKNRGFTLVEVLLVVGFVALASIGIYAVYNKISTSYKASETSRQVLLIIDGVKNLYGNQNTYGGLSNSVVINSRMLPSSMVDGATITDKFGNEITVRPTSYGGVLNNVITIELTSVPPEACAKIAPLVSQSVEGISVNGDGMVKMMPGYGLNLSRLLLRCSANEDGADMSFKVRSTIATPY